MNKNWHFTGLTFSSRYFWAIFLIFEPYSWGRLMLSSKRNYLCSMHNFFYIIFLLTYFRFYYTKSEQNFGRGPGFVYLCWADKCHFQVLSWPDPNSQFQSQSGYHELLEDFDTADGAFGSFNNVESQFR